MAPDWLSRVPSGISSTGTSAMAFIARHPGVRVAPSKKSTRTGSQSHPASWSASAAL